MYKLTPEKFHEFLKNISEGREVFGLARGEESESGDSREKQYHLIRGDGWDPDKMELGMYRPVEPLKSLIFRPREFLGVLDSSEKPPEIKERIVIGVKNCDLSALKIHDYVFLDTEPVDLLYKEARNKTVIVSCDCADARETCFCTAVNKQPYAKEGFDINISPVSDGYLVESGSEKGEELLKKAQQYLKTANDSIIKERDNKREEITKKVRSQAEQAGLKSGLDFQKAIQKTRESNLWNEFAEDCVECGACNFVCCTCHCFLLVDGVFRESKNARVKQWDSCLYKNFARVAGGANPRDHRAERLYNRFDKKFNFFPETLGTLACNGCGRCIEACPGKIDIREVLKRAADE